MNAQDRIRRELKTIMADGEANACNIFRSWHHSTDQTGWHFQRFGEAQVTYLGQNVDEAIESIQNIADGREPTVEEWPL